MSLTQARQEHELPAQPRDCNLWMDVEEEMLPELSCCQKTAYLTVPTTSVSSTTSVLKPFLFFMTWQSFPATNTSNKLV